METSLEQPIELETLLLPDAFSLGTEAGPKSPFIETQYSTANAENGLEIQNNALVWNFYNSETAKADSAILEASNRSIDVLLVFTGLFSAVLTSFIIQAYQLLIPGPFDATNALLVQLIDLQMRALNETNPPLVPVQVTTTNSTPSVAQLRWVSGLWFVALAFSLSVALFCMLGKQWLQSNPTLTGSSRHRARQRQQKYLEMKKWHVTAILQALPLLLHATLLLFFAGLIVFLSSENSSITVITCIIVAFVYTCYFGSAWLSLVYPDCPYVHPVSEQLRLWHKRNNIDMDIADPSLDDPTSKRTADCNPWREPEPAIIPSVVKEVDVVEAYAFIWLIKECPNELASPIALQAIGDLPRKFTAFHVLRDAGAVPLVLKWFQTCFLKDSTLDSQWYVIQPREAERYCKAWMRLTRNTSYLWPSALLEHLQALIDLQHSPDISAIAACANTMTSSVVRDGRLRVLTYLTSHTEGRVRFDNDIQRWLLDTFLQCSLISRSGFRPKPDFLVKQAITTFLRLLLGTKHTMASDLRSSIVLSLSYMTGTGNMTDVIFLDEERELGGHYYNLLIPSLAAIINKPSDFDVDNDLLDKTASEFAHLISRALVPVADGVRSDEIMPVTQRALSKLYLDGRIKHVSEHILSDVLQILHPPNMVKPNEYPTFVDRLLHSLKSSGQPHILIGPVLRLLEPLLSGSQPDIINVFIENNGIAAVIRAAIEGDTGSRRHQLDCIKCLCVFMESVAQYSSTVGCDTTLLSDHSLQIQLDHIFQSDFFSTLITILTSHPWWLPQVPEIWMPALVNLCRLRPQEPVWKNVEAAVSKFAGFHDGKDGHYKLTNYLDYMRALIGSNADLGPIAFTLT